MSAPMGVAPQPQRLQAIRTPSKVKRTQSEPGTTKPAKSRPSLGTATSKERGLLSKTASSASLSVGLGKSERVLSTNSRVQKAENVKKDMYLVFVNDALKQKARGVPGPYLELVTQFSSLSSQPSTSTSSGTKTNSAAQLRLWITALSHVVSQLEKTHSALIEAIINMPWTAMDAQFVKTYTAFISALVSAKPEFLGLVLSSTIQRMTYHSGLNVLASTTASTSSQTPITRRVVYDRLHDLLQNLLSVIPTLSSSLHPLILRNFPHKRLPINAQMTYIRNLLRLIGYCEELTEKVLGLIVDRALSIDVEIQVEVEELEELGNPISGFDLFDTVVGQDDDDDLDDGDDGEEIADDDGISDISSGSEGDNFDDQATSTRAKHLKDMVHKLDSILALLFAHLQQSYSSQSTSTSSLLSTTEHQFHSLMSVFERSILKTFKSRYTQFLLFWLSSQNPKHADSFLQSLTNKALGSSIPAPDQVVRCAAASYLGSFISRATFMDTQHTRQVVQMIVDYLEEHIEDGDAVWYALCQSFFLIFCFRWRDLEETNEGNEDDHEVHHNWKLERKKWVGGLDTIMQRLILHPSNPLKVCSPNVVRQFAKVSQYTGFIYCHGIIQANNRALAIAAMTSKQTSTAGISSDSQSNISLELSTFFPFDPYRLPLSARYVEDHYREWAMVAIDDDDDDEEEDEEEDSEEEDVEDDNEESTEKQGSGTDGGKMTLESLPGSDSDSDEEEEELGKTFGGMSISPARPGFVMSAI